MEVKQVIDNLTNGNKLFTVYDITRILKQKDKFVDHNDVRTWVRYYYQNGGFPAGWTNKIGGHLPYNPSPHIYAPPKANIRQYDPDALDPARSIINLVPVSVSMCNSSLLTSTQTEYWYALIYKPNKTVVRPNKGNTLGLYKTRQGPSQLKPTDQKLAKDYEIVKYKVTLERVDG